MNLKVLNLSGVSVLFLEKKEKGQNKSWRIVIHHRNVMWYNNNIVKIDT